jgi:hypothetical protein
MYNVIKANEDGTVVKIKSTGDKKQSLMQAYRTFNNYSMTDAELEINIIKGEYGYILFDFWVCY